MLKYLDMSFNLVLLSEHTTRAFQTLSFSFYMLGSSQLLISWTFGSLNIVLTINQPEVSFLKLSHMFGVGIFDRPWGIITIVYILSFKLLAHNLGDNPLYIHVFFCKHTFHHRHKVALTNVHIKLEHLTDEKQLLHFVVKVVIFFSILAASTPCLGFGICSFEEMFVSIMLEFSFVFFESVFYLLLNNVTMAVLAGPFIVSIGDVVVV